MWKISALVISVVINMNNLVKAGELAGSYHLTRASCSDGKKLKLGGPFMDIGIKLEISAAQDGEISLLEQTANAQSVSFASFKLTCTIINRGKLRYLGPGRYLGNLTPHLCECSNSLMQQKICARQMGAEAEGVTEYWWEGDELAIKNLATKNIYSCQNGAVPVYYYR